MWSGHSIELFPPYFLLKLAGKASQNKAVEQSQVGQMCSAMSGGFTWYRAEVASAVNCSAFLANVRNVTLLHCTSLTARDREIGTFAKLQLSVSKEG